jgi:predicted MFS family arabinose efflux permease
MAKQQHWTSLSIVGFIITTGLGFQALSPIMLGSLADTLGFSKPQIGLVLSVATLGVAVAGFLVPFIIDRWGVRILVRLGLTLLLAMHSILAFQTQFEWFLVLHFIAGIGGGLTYASALSILASLDEPVRGFGIYTITFCTFSAIMLFSLPYIVQPFGTKGGYLTLVALNVLALIGTRVLQLFPSERTKGRGLDLDVLRLLKRPGIPQTVMAYFALQAGAVGVFSFLERIGVEHGFAPEAIGTGLSMASLSGLLGAVLVNTFRSRVTPLRAVMLAFPVFFTSLVLFKVATSYLFFVMAMLLFHVAWGFVLPFYQSVQASYDKKGRVVSVGAFTNTLGQSTGPALVALWIGTGSYMGALTVAVIMFVLSISLIIPGILGLKE